MHGLLRGLGVALALTLSAGCAPAARSFGPTPPQARARADAFFGALAARFGPAVHEPAFETLRPKLVRSAFVPSNLFKDDSAWTGREGEARLVEFRGTGGSHYRLGLGADLSPPTQLADYRGRLRLRALGEGEFEWQMSEALAVGEVSAAELDQALTAVLRAAESATEEEARRRARDELPRTTARLSRLFTLDALRLAPAAEGGTAVTLETSLHPERLTEWFPHYGPFLKKYSTPLRVHAVADDGSGARWWEAEMRDNRAVLRLRVRDGSLAPLQGPPRRMPPALRVRMDVSTKMGIFRVGLKRLAASVTRTGADDEKSFSALFRETPDWQLPFLIEPFLRGSLRRPFEGEGSMLSFAALSRPGAQTLLVREYRVFVKESWIIRWLGGLMGGAVTEFRRGAEEEADRYTGEVLEALREDVAALAERGI